LINKPDLDQHSLNILEGESNGNYSLQTERNRCPGTCGFHRPNQVGEFEQREITRAGVVDRHENVWKFIGYVLLFAEGGFTEVVSLAVHPDFRRQGYGLALMHACLKLASAHRHTHMHLIVDSKKTSAEALYRQCGFKDSGGYMTFLNGERNNRPI
jgi:ribosomal protein S18 acetylase RimI-like enzyme